MTHRYARLTLRTDGSRFSETLEIDSEEVAVRYGKGRGGRLEFLELVNHWNRQAVTSREGVPVHIFAAEVTSS